MKIKIILCLLAVLITFTSCDVFTDTQTLLRPPKGTGELANIEEALYQKAGRGIRFAFPMSGNYRSSYISKDLDGDGLNEAIVFYTESSESAITHMTLLDKSGEKWKSVQDITAPGTGIDSIDFADLTGDGISEIIVSWNYNTRQKTINVYSYDGTENPLIPKMTENHMGYTICNLSGTNNELLLLNITPAIKSVGEDSTNVSLALADAKLYKFENDKPVLVGRAPIDGGISTVVSIKSSKVNEHFNGIYIDSFVAPNLMITDLICYENGKLVNKFYNQATGSNEVTLRDGAILSQDIDKDGFIEIPINYLMPGYEEASSKDNLYFSRWRRYDGKFFNFITLSFVDEDLGYYLKVDDSWIGNTTVLKNKDEHTDVYYEWNISKEKIEKELFRITVFQKEAWAKAKQSGYSLLKQSDKQYFGIKVAIEKSKYFESIEKIKENFVQIGLE